MEFGLKTSSLLPTSIFGSLGPQLQEAEKPYVATSDV